MVLVVVLLAGTLVAGLATNLAEGRAQRTALVCLVLLLAGLAAYSFHLSRDAG